MNFQHLTRLNCRRNGCFVNDHTSARSDLICCLFEYEKSNMNRKFELGFWMVDMKLRPIWPTGIYAALLVATMNLVLTLSVNAALKYYCSFFKSVKARSNNLKQFIKWRATLKRYSAELNSDKKMNCTSKGHHINSYGDWKNFLIRIKKI